MELQADVNKGGEKWLSYSIDRKDGLVMRVKTNPRLEGFMRSLGNGRTDDVSIYGRDWYATDPEKPLNVYEMDQHLPSTIYTAEVPAYPFNYEKYINISFLRLAGSSEGDGVTFGIKGVYSLDLLRDISGRIGKAVRQLVLDYVKPIGIDFDLVSREV